MINISLCMIVKNEEKNLYKCLNSAKKYIDEIIVVDTGSDDKTKEIAKTFTGNIYDFSWCNDFSKARNYSIEKAKNDWILILDGDEEIIEFDERKIKDFIKESSLYIGRIKRLNIIDRRDKLNESTYTERVNRVFNKKAFRYIGSIHEQLEAFASKTIKTLNVPIVINHIGYMEEQLKLTDKIERNINMLKVALDKNDKDPYMNYQLGKSLYMKKVYEEANIFFKKSLSYIESVRYEYVLDLVITYGYSLINSNNFIEALEIINYERYYEKVTDFMFLKGLILMNNGLFKKSVEAFLRCLGMEEGDIDGINSYKAYYNIGVIYECLGMVDEAVNYYKKAGVYELAKIRIRCIEANISEK